MAKLFGTDGIRGLANEELTPELSYKTARAIGHILCDDTKKIVLGKDTRRSGDMIEAALIAGFTSMGIDVIDLEIIPTPGLAIMIKKLNVDAGVMISASHNPGPDNGIKVFSSEALKLNEDIEREIEKYILNPELVETRALAEKVGIVERYENVIEELINYYTEKFPLDLSVFKIAIDCGNGANYIIAPRLFEKLNAEVIAINTEPDGMNINDNSGSTNPKLITELVKKEKADIGFSYDGDGDRIIVSDENGDIVDGDHILAILGNYLNSKNRLKGKTVVATVMSNMALDEYLNNKNMDIFKTKVGDKYILDKLVNEDWTLGGEQSGHIIIMDYNTTGDSLASSLLLLELLKKANKTISNLNNIKDYPQVLINAKVLNENKSKLDTDEEINKVIEEIENSLGENGRTLIRPSGTEPLIRVMIEAKVNSDLDKKAQTIVDIIEKRLGG